ncbi:hypothetical protein [Alicyclobacillus sp. ALC3]|uniref:hypothetical protein n=1 Tax=Alicyclobacillus sp. ALC3 TaxID=2796143 RepID=UPI002379D442|nr:hypothetical protein [Alicyclobacillus sp. ALC3]WDL95331.1 hypothetical protein JC200_12995 [Alicyclobacillus sp. ALC3]
MLLLERVPRPTRFRIYFGAFLVCAYLIPVLMIERSPIHHPLTFYVGDNQDSGQFMWYLGWFWHAVVHRQNPLTTNLLNYPSGLNLMTNTSVLTESVLFGPLVYIANPVFTFNVVVATSLFLAGVLGFLLFRAIGVSPWLAFLGGLLLEVNPFSVNQLVDGHINFSMSCTIVLSIAWMTVRYVRAHRQSVWDGVIMGLLFTALFYTSLEVFATFVFMGGVLLVISLPTYWKEFRTHLRPYTRVLVIAAITILVFASPGVLTFLQAPHGPYAHIMPPNTWVSDILSFLIPTPAQWVHTPLSTHIVNHFTGGVSEMGAYLSVAMLVGATLALFTARKKRWTWLLLFMGVFASVLSMGPYLHVDGVVTNVQLPWSVVDRIPLLGQATAGRFSMYEDIALVALVVLGLDHWTNNSRGRLMPQITSLAIVIASIVLWMPTLSFPSLAAPPSSRLLTEPGVVRATIGSRPTTVIMDAYLQFGSVMSALATAGYPFPVTNVYGFPYTSAASWGTLETSFPNRFLYSPDFNTLTDAQALAKLRAFLRVRHPSYILWLTGYTRPLPPSLEYALSQSCGIPMVTADGSKLWTVHRPDVVSASRQ